LAAAIAGLLAGGPAKPRVTSTRNEIEPATGADLSPLAPPPGAPLALRTAA
jgi:hypothetical protein